MNLSDSEDSEEVHGLKKEYGGGGSSIRDWRIHMQGLEYGGG